MQYCAFGSFCLNNNCDIYYGFAFSSSLAFFIVIWRKENRYERSKKEWQVIKIFKVSTAKNGWSH